MDPYVMESLCYSLSQCSIRIVFLIYTVRQLRFRETRLQNADQSNSLALTQIILYLLSIGSLYG